MSCVLNFNWKCHVLQMIRVLNRINCKETHDHTGTSSLILPFVHSPSIRGSLHNEENIPRDSGDRFSFLRLPYHQQFLG